MHDKKRNKKARAVIAKLFGFVSKSSQSVSRSVRQSCKIRRVISNLSILRRQRLTFAGHDPESLLYEGKAERHGNVDFSCDNCSTASTSFESEESAVLSVGTVCTSWASMRGKPSGRLRSQPDLSA